MIKTIIKLIYTGCRRVFQGDLGTCIGCRGRELLGSESEGRCSYNTHLVSGTFEQRTFLAVPDVLNNIFDDKKCFLLHVLYIMSASVEIIFY